MDITWPMSHRVSLQSLRDVAQRTYVGQLIPRQTTEVLDFLPSLTLPSWNLFGSIDPEGEGRKVGEESSSMGIQRGG